MSAFWLLMIILALAAVGFILGRSRAISSVQGDRRQLHSLPNYYGFNVAMLAFVPAVLVLGAWVIIQPMMISSQVSTHIPAALYEDAGQLNLIMSDVKRVAEGLDVAIAQGVMTADEVSQLDTETTDVRAMLGNVGVALGSDVDPSVLKAAQEMRAKTTSGNLFMTIVVLIVAAAGFRRGHAEDTGRIPRPQRG